MTEAPERITVSREALRAELAELELRLTRVFSDSLGQKADATLVASLDTRVAQLEANSLRRDGPLGRQMEDLSKGELPQALKRTIEDEVEHVLVAHTDKGWTARERVFGVIAIAVAILSLALAAWVNFSAGATRVPAPTTTQEERNESQR